MTTLPDHNCDLPTNWFVDGYRCSCGRCWVREPGGEWHLCTAEGDL